MAGSLVRISASPDSWIARQPLRYNPLCYYVAVEYESSLQTLVSLANDNTEVTLSCRFK